MKNRWFKQFVAMMLCLAMILPNLTGLATAVQTPSAQSVQTNTKWTPVSDPFASGSIPAYLTAGTVSAEALKCDCGNGLTNDNAKSYMKLVTGTTENEFGLYLDSLSAAGFTRTYNSVQPADESGNNIFYRFLSPNKDFVLTVYYTEGYKEVHIIADTAEDIVKSFSAGFVYESTTNEMAQTMMTMYGLSMSPNGYDNTTKTAYSTGARNCGALIIIRMPDNSLFINDGGDVDQWSDDACADFMTFCRELTGKGEGEKVIINTWFVSHAHSDHFLGFPRFIDQYHDQIDIKNVMYNIDDERKDTTRDMSGVMKMVHGYFPDAKYYKPHTGDSFDIVGVKFDVLYTQEDRFAHGEDKKLNIGDTASKTSDGGSYREFLYKDADAKTSDFNDTSTVLKVTFPEEVTKGAEVTSILYADVNLGDEVIMDMWPDSVLETDIMMVPHHGHDAHPELVALSKAKIFLYTQAKSAIYGPNGIVDQDVDPEGTYRYDDLVINFNEMKGSDGTEGYFGTISNERKTYWEGTETACILFGDDTVFDNRPEGLTRDGEDPAGFTVYTMDAPFFPYEGWSVFEAVVGYDEVSNNNIATQSSKVKFTRADTPYDNSRYLIMNNKYKYIMAYDAIPNIVGEYRASTGSLTLDPDGDSENTYYFGAEDESLVYIDNSDRDTGLWILQQYEKTDYGDFGWKEKEELGSLYKGEAVQTRFGGSKAYMAFEFVKGVGPTSSKSQNGTYWYSVYGNDGTEGKQYRWLHPKSVSKPFRRFQVMGTGNTAFETDIGKYFLEKFSDDTFLIYYIDDSKDYRVLTCDSLGNWYVKQYKYSTEAATQAAIKEDLDELKFRLYKYGTESGKKTIGFTGSTSFDVLSGTTAADLAAAIGNDWTVFDPNHKNQHIPFSGTSHKVGYYWVDLSNYDTSTTGTIQVPVYYCNDKAEGDVPNVFTQTLIATVTINVVDTVKDDNVLQPLIDLFTDRSDPVYKKDDNGNPTNEVNYYRSKLKNPDYWNLCKTNNQTEVKKLAGGYKYYPQYSGEIITDGSKSYTDQFFDAMEAVGYPCDWDLYARLAEVNRNALGAEYNTPDAPRQIVRDLIAKMKIPVGDGGYQTLSPYDYFYNAEGKNWWAEAIKGDTDKLYPVINKYAFEDNAAWGDDAYYGTVRNNYTTRTGLKLDGQDYISGFQGLGMDLYSVSFAMCADNLLTVDVAENILRNVSSGPSYFFAANTQDDLTDALNTILSTMSTAATRGWYTDTMGPDFNLSTEKYVVDHNGNTVLVNAAPTIKVMEYDLEPVMDANGNIVDYKRTGVPRVIETVTFEDRNGDGVTDYTWSNQVYTSTVDENGNVVIDYGNIWNEETGVISAKNFYYNTNVDQTVTIPFGAQGNYPLAPESFFWVVGVIGKAEIVLEYQVYLTGSIEGERFMTSDDYYHATNTSADLHYINYLGKNMTLGTVSPLYPWGDARVGVGYYLVNTSGEMISDQTTGATTTDFSQAVKITRPVYEYAGVLVRKECESMIIKKDLVSREIAGERFLVPVGKTVYGANGLFALTEVGGFIWDILPAATCADEIVKAVLETYDVDEATASKDVAAFLDQLKKLEIL